MHPAVSELYPTHVPTYLNSTRLISRRIWTLPDSHSDVSELYPTHLPTYLNSTRLMSRRIWTLPDLHPDVSELYPTHIPTYLNSTRLTSRRIWTLPDLYPDVFELYPTHVPIVESVANIGVSATFPSWRNPVASTQTEFLMRSQRVDRVSIWKHFGNITSVTMKRSSLPHVLHKSRPLEPTRCLPYTLVNAGILNAREGKIAKQKYPQS